jgi:hypothetical protein
MSRASFERRKRACFSRVVQGRKVSEDIGGAQSEMSLDVFEEAPFRLDFLDDTADMRPEMARVGIAKPLP